jgi:hypothetical protein
MPHHWQTIAAGRICIRCRLAQAKDEFKDDVPCHEDGDELDHSDKPAEPSQSK